MKYKKMFTALILVFSMLLSGCSLSEVADSAKSSIKDTVSSFVVGDAEDVPSISEDKYAYSVLDENTKKVYNQVLDAILNYETEVTISTEDTDVLQNAYDAVMADYGGLFWVYGYQANTYHTGDTVLGLTFSPTYTMTQSEQEVKQAEIDAVVEQWLSNLPADASDYDKAKYVYETLITNCDYDVNATDNQNIISVFLNGSTVCQGYADATSYLLNQLGIQSTIIVGTANNESHAWNMVRLDDQYYYIDTTWGNSTYSDSADAKFINYAYLNVTSEEISQNHTVEMNIELPECTATEDNYYHKEGLYFESGQLSEIGTLIQNAYNRGDETVSMKFNSAATYDSVYNYFITQSNIAKYCYGIQDIRYIEIQSANVLVLVFG